MCHKWIKTVDLPVRLNFLKHSTFKNVNSVPPFVSISATPHFISRTWLVSWWAMHGFAPVMPGKANLVSGLGDLLELVLYE